MMWEVGRVTLLYSARRSSAKRSSESHQPSRMSRSLVTSTGDMEEGILMGTSANGAMV